mgnify:CR=1 FL=1
MRKLDLLLIKSDALLSDAFELLNKNGRGICIVVKEMRIVGILTDGDIRRFLLKTNDLGSKVEDAMNKDYLALHINSKEELVRKSFTNGIKIIPLHDDDFRIVDTADVQNSYKIPVLEPKLEGNELKYIVNCLETNWISSQGKYVNKFEEMFSAIHNDIYSLSVSSGTTALHLALVALGIGDGDEVIIPNLTFAACANAVILASAKPVLCEVDAFSWCIDINEAEKLITKETKAIMAVHLYGQVCDIEPLVDLCKNKNIFLIEDCAEAIGSSIKERRVGTFGDASTFSFFGNKTISTGEGGMILFKKKEIQNKAKILRDHGMNPSKRYWHDEIGFNYRLTNLQASIGVAQLERFESILEKKLEIAKLYKKNLHGGENILMLPNEYSDVVNSNWLFTIILSNKMNRDLLIDELNNLGIETRPVFYNLHVMPPYINFRTSQSLLNSLKISKNGLSLPTSLSLQKEDIIYVCDSLKRLLSLKGAQN